MTAGHDGREEYFGHQHVTRIEPRRGWKTVDLRELWAYRELLWVLATRDVRVRYKQTLLGAGWAIVRPLLTMVVFSVVFGSLAKMPSDGYPYPVFVFAALLPWTFFSAAITSVGGSLLGASNLISKVYFPRVIVPLASLGSALVDLLVAILVLLGLMTAYGVPLTWRLAAVPCLLVGLLGTALGVGLWLSALTVRYRDVNHLLPFLVQIWLYATPVIYPVSLFPERWRWLIYLNPMTGLVEASRSAFLGRAFDGDAVVISFAVAALLFAGGLAAFERMERRVVDLL